jgi:hypothetical protein
MYLEDLSPYFGKDESHVAIGWIDRTHPFPTGPRPDELWLKKLYFVVSQRQFNYLPQMHHSDFLPRHVKPIVAWGRAGTFPVIEEGMPLNLGEIIVRHLNQTLHAPALIVHYILDQNYLPPAEFMIAINEAVTEEELERFEAKLAYHKVRQSSNKDTFVS